jgi:hypothetical protein
MKCKSSGISFTQIELNQITIYMKCFLVLILSLVCLSLNAQKYQGDSWATVKTSGKGTLTIVYYKQPGLIYSENGKMKGVCVEVISDFVEFVERKYGKKWYSPTS